MAGSRAPDIRMRFASAVDALACKNMCKSAERPRLSVGLERGGPANLRRAKDGVKLRTYV
jgi:hypothetical protein